eukprot:TRINITY_DN2126_c0_g1_i1.p2 TRINITY_DN2126_c0_g1~~TRINITY_DN2126_c0_g1_i1.p2  ORF type:complete len:197 (-),score=90.81 TRINITY_DN2126_c0_g1_i1:29-619(-)
MEAASAAPISPRATAAAANEPPPESTSSPIGALPSPAPSPRPAPGPASTVASGTSHSVTDDERVRAQTELPLASAAMAPAGSNGAAGGSGEALGEAKKTRRQMRRTVRAEKGLSVIVSKVRAGDESLAVVVPVCDVCRNAPMAARVVAGDDVKLMCKVCVQRTTANNAAPVSHTALSPSSGFKMIHSTPAGRTSEL